MVDSQQQQIRMISQGINCFKYNIRSADSKIYVYYKKIFSAQVMTGGVESEPLISTLRIGSVLVKDEQWEIFQFQNKFGL
jgi:hypothetical protein